MASQNSIATVTVAYNSVRVLSKQLDALLRQTRHLDEIVVVNNASTDGTANMLSTKYPQVTVLNLPANVGVGGGFAAGLAYAALQKKHDWIWLLDQDSVPASNAVDQLLCGYFLSEQQGRTTGVVASFPKHEQSGLSYPGLLWRERLVRAPTEACKQPIWFVDATISSGTMIRRDVVETVGLPRADFFLDFVDFEYSLRIRRHGYDIAMVRDSILHHTVGEPRLFQFLGYKRAWSDHAPWREYYLSRNHTYVVWHLYPSLKSKLFLMMRLAKHGTAILFFSRHRLAGSFMVLRGFLDGWSKRLGIRSRDVASPVGFFL